MLKIIKNIFKIAIEILIIIIIIFATYVLTNDSFIHSMVSNIFMLVLVVRYLFPWINNFENKNLKKSRSEDEKDLFMWANSISGVENYIKFIFKEKPSSNVIKNLNTIKTSLLDSADNNLEQLRLLRAFFKSYKESKSEFVYFKAVGAGITSFMVFILQASILGNVQNKAIHEFIRIENSWGLIISILLVAIYFIILPHKGENRVNLICNILDECIEEFKNKEPT